MTPKRSVGSGKAGLLTRSLCTPSRPGKGSGTKSVQNTAELTATGIVPDFHRSSLLIPSRQPPTGNLAGTKIEKAAGNTASRKQNLMNKF